jgi:biofilm PGA synthesis N-glycosyltransferase PgaC
MSSLRADDIPGLTLNFTQQPKEKTVAGSATDHQGSEFSYVLMTAAYNEEAFIEKTIVSVLAQRLLPLKWVVVSDGSTDKTDAIVQRYASQHPLISLVRVAREPGRSFASKVLALHRAEKLFAGLPYDFIGNIDADLGLEPDYFKSLLDEFRRDPQLGLASGFVYEFEYGEYRSRSKNNTQSVPHAAQLVRRECYEAIGGYAVLKYGGEDWHAQTSVRLKGWRAEAFPSLKIFHQRHTATSGGTIQNIFRQGRMDYSFGSYPPFELIKCLTRCFERPLLVGALARLSGFVWSYLAMDERVVSTEFIAFLRGEQKAKMLSILNDADFQ